MLLPKILSKRLVRVVMLQISVGSVAMGFLSRVSSARATKLVIATGMAEIELPARFRSTMFPKLEMCSGIVLIAPLIMWRTLRDAKVDRNAGMALIWESPSFLKRKTSVSDTEKEHLKQFLKTGELCDGAGDGGESGLCDFAAKTVFGDEETAGKANREVMAPTESSKLYLRTSQTVFSPLLIASGAVQPSELR